MSTPVLDDVVIVGAGLAATACAQRLRELGYGGRVTLIGREERLPYDRPPLSKQVLTGAQAPEATELRPASWYVDHGIEVRLGAPAAALDLDRESVALSNGDEIRFGSLVVATGSACLTLPGIGEIAGVHYLRTLDEAIALRDAFRRQPRVAVVGAGLVGSEVAATARSMGLEVTLLEAASNPWEGVVGERMARAVRRLHEEQGTVVRSGAPVTGFSAADGVALAGTDDAVPADLVVVAVGVRPDLAWLSGTGLATAEGLLCDRHLRTEHPSVWGAGDVASWVNPLSGTRARVEHWTNARAQGRLLAHNLVHRGGAQMPYEAVPYFWSQQYGHLIQCVGWVTPDVSDILEPTRGAGGTLVAYCSGRRVVGAFAVDRAGPCMLAKGCIARGQSVDELQALVAASALSGTSPQAPKKEIALGHA